MSVLSGKATVSFQIRESGTSATTATVAPGGALTLDVVAVTISAEAGILPNLDSFTYRIIFPNTSFMLQNNVFAAPFDNAEAPAGFNGSIPWSGLPLPIDLVADGASPGATALVPDLYRTTATTAGVPVVGPDAVLETLTLQVPLPPGNYPISLSVLEAADNTGALHATENGTDFVLTIETVDPCLDDSTPPTIVLNGSDPLNIECGTAFVDPGATATDDCPEPGTPVAVNSSGVVDPNTPGSYVITYSATDASGNPATDTRTVNVVDTTAPVITLNGANPLTVECHTAFIDPGATATDLCAGSVPVSTAGAVDANTPGSYVLTYTATDPSGNLAMDTRTVNVVDTTDPVIALNGANPLIVPCRTPFIDPGATAADLCAGIIAVGVSGTVDINTAGDYTLTYTATDPSGNAATATRTVTVTECGIFALTCPPDLTVPNDAGLCSAVVNYPDPVPTGGVGTVSIVCNPPSGSVFPVGATIVNCTATDEADQTATCSFTVTVNDEEPPVITCPPDVTVQCLGDVPPPDFAEGSAVDNCDPAPVVAHLGDVPAGTNPTLITRTYQATDASGNTSSCTQTITVQGLPGDLNGDCCVDLTDLDLLMVQIRARSTDLTYDLNGDGQVDIADARWLVLRFTNPGGAPCP
jgi:hypothetical protein